MSEEATNDLDWGLKEKDDEPCDDDGDDDVASLQKQKQDPFSPEKARGTFLYTVHSPDLGITHTIRRSSRHSFGSPLKGNTKKKVQK